jgi:hypothetical protein
MGHETTVVVYPRHFATPVDRLGEGAVCAGRIKRREVAELIANVGLQQSGRVVITARDYAIRVDGTDEGSLARVQVCTGFVEDV